MSGWHQYPTALLIRQLIRNHRPDTLPAPDRLKGVRFSMLNNELIKRMLNQEFLPSPITTKSLRFKQFSFVVRGVR
jgi:hypothetical protein